VLGSVALLIGLSWAYEASQLYVGSKDTVVGRVTHVRDGDTIEVLGRAVRLKGLTCDERGTVLGEVATKEIKSIVAGQIMNCVMTSKQSYDRAIGWCSLSDGRDIGALLIERGVCGRCDRYDPFRKYAAVQAEAGAFTGSYPSYCWAPW